MDDIAATFHAHGKLLLTAEYFVLDGSMALAIPVRFGQSLHVFPNAMDDNLHWKSFDETGNCWFEAVFGGRNVDLLSHSDPSVAMRLLSIFREIKEQNPSVPTAGTLMQTRLEFPRNWGLGTSSTLVFLLAKWAGIDPFGLQFKTFGGSGYDIACAGASGPILYQLENGRPVTKPCSFAPAFSENLFFIFLGNKQNSREGIKQYRQSASEMSRKETALRVSRLTGHFLKAQTLEVLEEIMAEHEQLISKTLGMPKAKDLYFSEYWGEIKSLGAWGGDFVLATSNRPLEETQRYFNEKGFDVFIPYNQMTL